MNVSLLKQTTRPACTFPGMVSPELLPSVSLCHSCRNPPEISGHCICPFHCDFSGSDLSYEKFILSSLPRGLQLLKSQSGAEAPLPEGMIHAGVSQPIPSAPKSAKTKMQSHSSNQQCYFCQSLSCRGRHHHPSSTSSAPRTQMFC